MKRRDCALVLGMHRSGTSCVAGALSHLGFAAPAQLIGANPANPKGHWESTPVARFNDRILDFAGSNWRDWGRTSRSWHNSPYYDRFVDEGVTILSEVFGDAPMIVLKDPRVCRLTDVWLEILKREGFLTTAFIPLRHPVEVSASIELRNKIDPTQAQFLWLRYMLDAEQGTRGKRRFMFRYADFVNDWRGILDRAAYRTDAVFPRLNVATSAAVDEFVDQSLYRNRLENVEGDSTLHPLVAETFAIFSAWADGEEDAADYERLDEIEHAFTGFHQRFQPLFKSFDSVQAQLDALCSSVLHQKSRVDEALAHLASIGSASSADTTDFRIVFDKQAADLGCLVTSLSALSQNLLDNEHGLRGNLAGLIAHDHGTSGNDLKAANSENAQLREQASMFRNRAEQLQADIKNHADAADAAQNAYQRHESEAAIAADRAKSTIAEMEGRLSVLTSELEQKRAETDQIYSENDSLLAQIASLEGKVEGAAERERKHLVSLSRSSDEILDALDDIVAIGNLLRNAEQQSLEKESRLQSQNRELERLKHQLEIKVLERREIRTKKEQADEKLIKLRGEHAHLQASSAKAKHLLTESQARIALLSEQLAERSSGKAEADRKLHSLRERHDALLATNKNIQAKLKQAEQKGQIELSSMMHASAILQIMATEKISFPHFSRQSRLLGRLPGTSLWNWRKFCTKLAAQGAFHAEAYLSLNPDVEASGMDPLIHYLTKGLAERRQLVPGKDA